ncbi:MAG: L-histidine N(alpha)-methyltransferase [Candidatus Zixiibacteriota bacterium]
MPSTYKIIESADYADSFSERHAFAVDVLVGLCEPRKSLPSKYLYDERGSELFTQITKLPEYYVTGCEFDIFHNQTADIFEPIKGEPFNLVELGAGDGQKTVVLLEYLLSHDFEFRYVPIDISEAYMKNLVERLAKQFPSLDVYGLVSEYYNGLKWLNNRHSCRNYVMFLGSSLGNFTPAESRVFLRNVWSALNHNDLMLTGFDLKKDIELLLAAYNDSQGITSEFNLNILDRINRELGGHFNRENFRHFGTYDVFSGAMESYLVSLVRQSVLIEEIGRSFEFEPWEPIHTEYSYKYLTTDIERVAAETGFVLDVMLYDSKKFFADAIMRVHKPGR